MSQTPAIISWSGIFFYPSKEKKKKVPTALSPVCGAQSWQEAGGIEGGAQTHLMLK